MEARSAGAEPPTHEGRSPKCVRPTLNIPLITGFDHLLGEQNVKSFQVLCFRAKLPSIHHIFHRTMTYSIRINNWYRNAHTNHLSDC